MVLNNDQIQNLVYNHRLSSVGPSRITGTDITFEPNGVDLALKLHYIQAIYMFSSEACESLTIKKIKESFFYWSNEYYVISGRFRRSEDTGRPYVKCNDCGIRFVEAHCHKTMEEWVEMRDASMDKLLVYHLPIGPDISFSPSLYIQFTKFKCGGMSVGLNWAHILGDAFSLSHCLKLWGEYLSGSRSNGPIKIIQTTSHFDDSLDPASQPFSVKRVDPVGDHWVTPNNYKMETFTFHITASQLSQLRSQIWGHNEKSPIFESICAVIWQSIAKARDGLEPKTITICKKGPNNQEIGVLTNNQIISSVNTDSPIMDSDLKSLAILLMGHGDEKPLIEAAVEKDNGVSDYIVYGANLTFLDLDGADLYGLEFNGHKPEYVSYNIQGVGDNGAVVVSPWPKSFDNSDNVGRIVIVTLQENELPKVKIDLQKYGLFV